MTTDELSAAKAEFNRQINTNQNQAQALLEIETTDVENSLQADSFAYTWFQQVPELLFNPFQDEESTETVRYPCSCIMQDRTLHGKQLIDFLTKALKEKTQIPFTDSFINIGNGNEFLGLSNKMLLSVQAYQKGYRNPNWCSYGFIMKNGFKIKVGEQPTYLCYWSFEYDRQPISFSEAFRHISHKEATAKSIVCKGNCYAVYNAEQIIGISSLKEDIPFPLSTDKALEKCKHIVSGMGVKVLHNKQSTYDLKGDSIGLPKLSDEQYCIELIYQACYATAHKERLNRSLEKWQETLCCLIAGTVMCNRLHLKKPPILLADTIQELHKQLTVNQYAFFMIIKEARRMIEYMMELCPDDKRRNLADYDFSQSLRSRLDQAKKIQKGGV